MKSTKKKFSDIECSGFVITDFTNESYGEIYCEEVSADGELSSKPTKKVYAELGEVLLAALSETGDGIDLGDWAFYGSSSVEIWDYIESELDDGDCESLFECFEAYSNWVKIESFEKLLELSALTSGKFNPHSYDESKQSAENGVNRRKTVIFSVYSITIKAQLLRAI